MDWFGFRQLVITFCVFSIPTVLLSGFLIAKIVGMVLRLRLLEAEMRARIEAIERRGPVTPAA